MEATSSWSPQNPICSCPNPIVYLPELTLSNLNQSKLKKCD